MKTETIVLGGGCFWCTEAVFKMLKGIKSVTPGYSGGTLENPTYEDVSNGNTGHAECTKVEYDPDLISARDILTVFFGSHDPTSLNRQGADVGTQYRSVVFYTTNDQKVLTESYIQEINSSNKYGRNVVTEVLPLDKFYEAESYHKDYFERNKTAPYCELVINPKLEKVVKEYANLLNDKSKQN